jgi:hypothetical protein
MGNTMTEERFRPARCEWCGVFVRSDTRRSTRETEGGDRVWRTFSQLLCPPCAHAAMTPSSFNRPLEAE